LYAAAYGLAVVTVMLLDTSLLAAVMVLAWGWSLLSAAAFWLPFTVITGAFFSSTLEKVPKGAWFRWVLRWLGGCWWFGGCWIGAGLGAEVAWWVLDVACCV
jgi:KUP system potassium uptake protein